MEAIILAGGLGTRLKSVVSDMPKSMALINSKPFMEYVLDYFISQGINKFIFSVGYKSVYIKNHFGTKYRNCEIVYAEEETQLGTGGAVKNAMQFAKGKNVVVSNGDSVFFCDIKNELNLHIKKNADVTLALKPMKNFSRYGTVTLNKDSRITKFQEKRDMKEGIINAGVYIFNVNTFNQSDLPDKFSIEKDFFETKVNSLKLYGYTDNGYFLDIGIPEDFNKAQYEIDKELAKIR